MDNASSPALLLREYEQLRPQYEDLANGVARLLATLMADAGLRFHSITCRTKEPPSLLRKLEATQESTDSLPT